MKLKSQADQIERSVANGSPPLRHCFELAALHGRNDAEIGPANSLHASAEYSKYNERFDLMNSNNFALVQKNYLFKFECDKKQFF